MDSKVTKFFENATTYFSKVTEQNLYRYQNVLEYVDGEYQLTNKITEQNIHDMRVNMDEADAIEFDKFIEKYWGEKVGVTESATVEAPKRRGRKTKTETE